MVYHQDLTVTQVVSRHWFQNMVALERADGGGLGNCLVLGDSIGNSAVVQTKRTKL
jgi:hypothetical protein